MIIDGNKLTAEIGKEIYNINEPEQYGTKITLAEGDINNWSERDVTIEGELDDLDLIL